ncbi:MAG: ABC transporter permease [Acidimicrobiia bacterium]|nr:ABC transporter permease [Acidimicrobiia bacterium]
MKRFIFRRTIQSVLLFVGVVVIVFFLVRLSGDPARLMMPREASPEQVQAFRESMGFDRPVIVQLGEYVTRVFTGDFGESLRFQTHSIDLVIDRVPLTFTLATLSMGVAIIIGIPLGIWGGMNANKPSDLLARGLGLAGQVTPEFWLALVLIILFAVNLGWFPSFGIDGPASYVLPAFALSVGAMGRLVRLTRSTVLEVVSSDFVRTARSKGLSGFEVAGRHIVRNTALALVSVISVQYTYLLGGAVYIESIFALPGLGSLLDEAIRARDFPLVQTITLFIGGAAIALSLVADLLYAWLDPRIRLEN